MSSQSLRLLLTKLPKYLALLVHLKGDPFRVRFRLGVLGFNASATARVISRRWNDDDDDDDDEISFFMVEETGVPGGNHRPTASNWRNFSHIRPLPSPGIELGPQRCEAKWAKAWWERRLATAVPGWHDDWAAGHGRWHTYTWYF